MGPEKHFETKIKEFLDSEGAWYVKYFANRNTKSGIPDVLACINGYFVGIEVKAQNGTVKALQEHHLTEIRIAGGFSFALYPSGFEKFKEFIRGLKKDSFNKELPLILK